MAGLGFMLILSLLQGLNFFFFFFFITDGFSPSESETTRAGSLLLLGVFFWSFFINTTELQRSVGYVSPNNRSVET